MKNINNVILVHRSNISDVMRIHIFLLEIFGRLIHRVCKLYHATFECNVGTTQIKYTSISVDSRVS